MFPKRALFIALFFCLSNGSSEELRYPVDAGTEISKNINLEKAGFPQTKKLIGHPINVTSSDATVVQVTSLNPVTNILGTITVKFKVIAPGSATLQLQDSISTAQQNAPFTMIAGSNVDIQAKALSMSDPSGTDTLTYTATVKDGDGNAIAGETVTFSLANTTYVTIQGANQGTTDANGKASITLKAKAVGSVEITASATDAGIVADTEKIYVIDAGITAHESRVLTHVTVPLEGQNRRFRAQGQPTSVTSGTYHWSHDSGGTFSPNNNSQAKTTNYTAPGTATTVADKGTKVVRVQFKYLGAIAEATTAVDIVQPASFKKKVTLGAGQGGNVYSSPVQTVMNDKVYHTKCKYYVYDNLGNLMSGWIGTMIVPEEFLAFANNEFPGQTLESNTWTSVASNGYFSDNHKRTIPVQQYDTLQRATDVHLRLTSQTFKIRIIGTTHKYPITGTNTAVLTKAGIESTLNFPDKP